MEMTEKHDGNGKDDVNGNSSSKEEQRLTGANVRLRKKQVIGEESRESTKFIPDTIPTDTVGKIRFPKTSTYDQQFLREYVRLDATQSDNFVDFLQKDWKLKKPSLLIAIAGGNESAEFPGKEEYFRGIVNAAVNADAWIITSGTNSGVSKDIGHVARNHRHTTGDEVIVIGIADWCSIREDHRNKLKRNENEIREAEKDMKMENAKGIWFNLDEDIGCLACYLKTVELTVNDKSDTTGKKTGKLNELEPNHTHFVLVDGIDRQDDGITARVQFERAISKWHNDSKTENTEERIPLVYIAVNDGEDCITTARQAFNDDIPFIAVHPSEATLQHMKRIFGTRKYLLNVVDADRPDMDDKINDALKRAAMGGSDEHYKESLMLALKLDTIEMIEKSEIRMNVQERHTALHYAIIHNRTEFIELLLEGDVEVKFEEFLTEDRLLQLFNSQPDSSILVKLLRETNELSTFKNNFTIDHVNNLIERLTGEMIQVKPSEWKSAYDGTIQKLFIYAILTNFDEMAEYFWSRCADPLSAALVAGKIYRSMSKLKRTSEDWEKSVQQKSRKYEDYAYDILTYCGENQSCDASDLLIRELPQWGNITCLNIADAAGNMRFMSHSVVEHLLHKNWYGMIYNDDVIKRDEKDSITVKHIKSVLRPLLFMVYSVLPFLIPIFVRFRESKGNHQYLSLLKIWWFYASPDTVFRNSMVSYAIFLFLFSYNLLWGNIYISIDQATSLDKLLMVWVAAMVMEEIIQIVEWEAHGFLHKMKGWWSDPWNQLDFLAVTGFIIGSCFRFTATDDPHTDHRLSDWARIILAADLFIYYIRFLEYLTVVKGIGPKVLMITKMFRDLGFFMCILFIILLGYGVSVHVLLYQYVQEPAWTVFQSIFFRSYFQIYGELFLENIKATPSDGSCTYNTSDINHGEQPCALHPEFGVFLLGIYLLLSNVLLLNLLIAMFSNTFSLVQEQNDQYWKFQRYTLTREYVEKPMLVPPFCIVSPYAFIIRRLALNVSHNFAMHRIFAENKSEMLTHFEENQTRHYLYIRRMSSGEEQEQRENTNL